ncbi:MAG: cysteine--tRNA ligase [Rhizobium sp.]|nr:MAG: cysteine--tRNA ligase [Rhizobium sp.]
MSLRLKLHNTLTREKAEFAPIDPENVRMYVCGPTVYDFAHIGNARPVIVFDVLFRLLRHVYGENHVTYARNITDVDDKINARALRDYPHLPLNDAIHAVTEKTADQFHADVAALGCLQPSVEPRATDNIAQMIDIIEKLIARGHAYAAGGEVLFDTRSMADYGQLSKRPLDEQQAGARVAVDAHKKNPGDFVLWKLSSHNEPGWESPWGRGRPGWHIECSAMSGRYLGDVFDIHGGGLDLIFPHHENEIAQSRCAHGTHVMANVWMHNGFVQVEGRKMSKSEGNFVTIYELLHTEKFGGRKWPGEVLRLAMLMTHYREPIDFSVKRLEEATVLEALADDLNTVAAVQALHALAHAANVDPSKLPAFAASAALLGVLPKKAEMDEAIVSAVDALVQLRLEMLKAEKGIQLKDGKDKETGERTTTWELKR